jgi:hypothetical protein
MNTKRAKVVKFKAQKTGARLQYLQAKFNQ